VGTENAAGLVVVGPGTPYVVPQTLLTSPTGISWSTIPVMGASADVQYAAQLNMCMRATAMIDEYCNQPLRATVDTETFHGPGGFRCQLKPSGVVRMLTSRSPVLGVVAARWSPTTAFPRSWTTIDPTHLVPERPQMGVYGTSAPSAAAEGGQGLLMAPGYISWAAGRESCEVEVTYTNGWPHASITTTATLGSASLVVDDITGWAGATGIIHDGSTQETISVTSVTPASSGAVSGPGTLHLATALVAGHATGVMVTTMPGTIIQAGVLLSASQALVRGATATTVQSVSGGKTSGATGPNDLRDMAYQLLRPYRRVL
jgi:hypothetical protein